VELAIKGDDGYFGSTQPSIRRKDSQMDVKMHEQPPIRRQRPVLLVLVAFVLFHGVAAAQGLTGALIGTVKDDQGGVLASAVVRLGSRGSRLPNGAHRTIATGSSAAEPSTHWNSTEHHGHGTSDRFDAWRCMGDHYRR
jgi:hypothetical protein